MFGVASLMSLTASLVTTGRMHQYFNAITDIFVLVSLLHFVGNKPYYYYKRHTIAHPHGWAMVCFVNISEKVYPLVTRFVCISKSVWVDIITIISWNLGQLFCHNCRLRVKIIIVCDSCWYFNAVIKLTDTWETIHKIKSSKTFMIYNWKLMALHHPNQCWFNKWLVNNKRKENRNIVLDQFHTEILIVLGNIIREMNYTLKRTSYPNVKHRPILNLVTQAVLWNYVEVLIMQASDQ